MTTLTEHPSNVPLSGTDTRQLVPVAKYRTVAAWSGIRRWYSPASYESGHWFDVLSGRDSGNQLDHSVASAAAPGLVTIGGKSYVNLNGVARLGTLGRDDFLQPSEFTLAFIWHPNGLTGAGARYLTSAPAGCYPVRDASNRFPEVWYVYFGGSIYGRVSIGDAYSLLGTDTNNVSLLYSNSAPMLWMVSHSASGGLRLRVDQTGAAACNKAVTLSAGQTPTRGGIQLGNLYASASPAEGALGDVMVFDRDLSLSANAATLSAVRTQLMGDWL